MANVLFELGLEEVPARFIDSCLSDLKQNIKTQCKHHRLWGSQTQVIAYATYRRFCIVIEHILDQQESVDQMLEGPPVRISKSDDGEWLPPAIGFAKKCGVTVDELTPITNQKGQEILAVHQYINGQPAMDILPQLFEVAVKNMNLPIAMVWGTGVGPFIRPIQWVCALMDQHVIQMDLWGVQSANISFGHRFLTKGKDASSGAPICIESANTYVKQLMDHHVWVDPINRKNKIQTDLLQYVNQVDDALLQEVTHLVECPTVLLIPFDESFLNLPKEVLESCLKKHQKAFLVESDTLKNECLIVADSVTQHNQSSIVKGNQRVMLARLNDVQFFWNEDVATKGFKEWNQKLKNVGFQDGLGSLADKVERISHICHTVMDQLNTDASIRDVVDRSAHRCKADLVSQMVGELPNLQGVMGGYYALRFRELPDVAIAIRDHYQPRFDGDRFPETVAGVILSIADRIDTMVACFENNAIPTGSRDPWGIRRSMLAIGNMILQFKLPLNLQLLLEDATLTLHKNVGENTQKCSQFFLRRLETIFLDAKIPVQMIHWVKNDLLSNPFGAYQQAKALHQLKTTHANQYTVLVDTATRVQKLVKVQPELTGINRTLFEQSIEGVACDAFEELKADEDAFYTNSKQQKVVLFCQTMADYLQDVLVNSENIEVAKNRQWFIHNVNTYFAKMGDWTALEKSSK